MPKERWNACNVSTRPEDVDILAFSCFSGQWIRAWIDHGYVVTVPCGVPRHIPVSVHEPCIEDKNYPLYMDVMRILRQKKYTDIRAH